MAMPEAEALPPGNLIWPWTLPAKAAAALWAAGAGVAVVVARRDVVPRAAVATAAASSQPAKAAQTKLESEFSKRERELQELGNRLRQLGERLERDAMVMSESERSRRQREVADLDKDFQRRQREFRADAGAAALMGRKQPMVNALTRLQHMQSEGLPPSLQAMGISGGLGKMFSSHPPLEERIAALQNTA